MSRKLIYIAAPCLVMLLFPLQGYGKSAANLVKEGNNAYNASDYGKAITAYDEALKNAPESPYVYFDKGAALYKKGDYTGAADAFEKAAIKSKDPKFEAKSKFNLGNSAYKEAEGLKAKDMQKALDGCSKSITHYQEAIALDPDLKEAAENIEIVRPVMKNILDEIKKQKESSQKDQEKKKQATEKLKEIIKEQEAALEKDKKLDAEKKDDSKERDKKIGQLADEQKAIKDKTEALSKEWPKDTSNASDKDAASKHLENATKEQDAATGNLGQKNTKEAAKNQEKAVKELKEILDSGQKDGNNSSGQNNDNKQGEQKDQQQEQKDQQQQQQEGSSSDKNKQEQGNQDQVSAADVSNDAKDILNDEKQNKEQRGSFSVRGYKGVDKDW